MDAEPCSDAVRCRRVRIAVLASGRWAPFAGSVHSTALALGELGHEVLLVDPPVSPLSVVRHPERRSDLLARRVEEVGSGVRLWRPVVAPGQNSAVGQLANARVLQRGIARHLGRPDLTLTSSLEARGVLALLPAPRVYLCIDSFEDLPGVDADALRDRERQLLGEVELAVAPSPMLTDQLRHRGARAVTIAHGVDPELLDAGGPRVDVASLSRPVVGYVGAINFRLDAALIAAAADVAATLVVLGGWTRAAGRPADPRVTALLSRPNVHRTGHLSRAEVRSWLGAFDLAVVPYSDVPFNRKSYPLKVLEYLAAGLPVVSSSNGAAAHLRSLVRTADDADTFRAAIVEELEQDDAARRSARREAMRARPWRLVASELLAAVEALP